MKFLIFISLLIVFLAATYADDEVLTPPELALTDANFDETIKAQKVSLVEFFAPWCGHCKALAPKYTKAAETLKADGINIYTVDATVHTKSANKYGVKGYPTLFLFHDGDAVEYEGPRDSDTAIVNYMREQNKPSTTELNTVDEYNKAKGSDTSKSSIVIGMFVASNDRAVFNKVARKFVDKGLVAYSTESSQIMESAGYFSDASGIFIYPCQGKGKKVMFRGPVTSVRLEEFIVANALSAVGVVTKENSGLYNAVRTARNSLVLEVFYKGNEAPVEALKKAVKGWEHKPNSIFRVALMDATQFSTEASLFSFTEAKLKNNHAAVFVQGDKKYILPDGMELAEFHKAFVAGKINVYTKSEPVPPEAKKGEVVVVVGATFEKIVHDESKNVMIEFYAPWCGHCKALAPKYDELAKNFGGVDNVVIAKMDSTTNDIPKKFSDKYDVTGFPTIYFVPAGKKGKVLKFDGARETDGMEKWIREKI